MEHDFDKIYRAGQEHIVPDFLSRIYLAEMTVSEDEEGDWKLALEKNKIYIPLQDQSLLLERSHRLYTGQLRTAKLFAFMSQRFFWKVLYKDVKNVCDSCSTCAQIYSTIYYQHMKPVEAVHPFQMVSLDTGVITYGNNQKFSFVVAVNNFTRSIRILGLIARNLRGDNPVHQGFKIF